MIRIVDNREGNEMNMPNKQQLLRDPEIQPTDEIIADGLGEAYKTYVRFVQELERYSITLMDWRYYNDGKAWLSKGEYKWTTSRGTNKTKPIFWLSIWSGLFKVSFFFGFDIREELLLLPISQNAKESIKNAKLMGKTMKTLPIVFEISHEAQLNDVYLLSEVRKTRVR